MIELDSLANKIFSLMKGNGLKIKIFDNEGAETTDPSQGRRFFVMDPNLMVTIDEEGNRVEFSKGASAGESVQGIQKNIRKLADEFQMNSDIKVFGKTIQPRDYAYQAKMQKESIDHIAEGGMPSSVIAAKTKFNSMSPEDLYNRFKELADKRNTSVEDVARNTAWRHGYGHMSGYYWEKIKGMENPMKTESITEGLSKMFGSSRTSQQTLENVRILVKHKVPVDENVRGARTRQISAIFLECNGERFRFPHNYLPGARAMAQHMAHGGTMNDKVGSYITESIDNLMKLQSFNRYVTTNKLINEDSSGIVETVKENIETIRRELQKLTGVKTYETISARIETFERESLEENDTSDLKDLFTIRRFDEKFEEVLPIVKQLVYEKDSYRKRIEETAAKPVMLRRETINTTPMFEFAGENARLGFKISELSLRILENDELATFVGKIGTKLCKEGVINDFEKAVITQVLENAQVEEAAASTRKEIKESEDLSVFFDKYTMNFF